MGQEGAGEQHAEQGGPRRLEARDVEQQPVMAVKTQKHAAEGPESCFPLHVPQQICARKKRQHMGKVLMLPHHCCFSRQATWHTDKPTAHPSPSRSSPPFLRCPGCPNPPSLADQLVFGAGAQTPPRTAPWQRVQLCIITGGFGCICRSHNSRAFGIAQSCVLSPMGWASSASYDFPGSSPRSSPGTVIFPEPQPCLPKLAASQPLRTPTPPPRTQSAKSPRCSDQPGTYTPP